MDNEMTALLDWLVDANELDIAAQVANYETIEALNVEDFQGRERARLVDALVTLELLCEG